MKRLLKEFWFALSCMRLLPHLALYKFGSVDSHLHADVLRWGSVVFGQNHKYGGAAIFCRIMTFYPEFRNIFYYRLGMLGRLFVPLCRPVATLYIVTPKIGPGLFIQHGFATIISAHEIGANCWINQQVTIGFSNDTDRPTLGDGVTVHAGAKVIGEVYVGNFSTIGANAVVVRDVPANSTVVGVPARIVRRDGVRVDEPLGPIHRSIQMDEVGAAK